jgi:large subunit ribosomal protein L7A
VPEHLRAARRKAVGAKQTLRALQAGLAEVVYVAQDAEDRVVRPALEAAAADGVPVVKIDTMARLGRLCGIEVQAACAAIISKARVP